MGDYRWHLWSEIKPSAEDLLPSIGQRAQPSPLRRGRDVDVKVYRIFNMVSLGVRDAVELLVYDQSWYSLPVFAAALAKLVRTDRRAQQVVVVWIRWTWPIRTHKKMMKCVPLNVIIISIIIIILKKRKEDMQSIFFSWFGVIIFVSFITLALGNHQTFTKTWGISLHF